MLPLGIVESFILCLDAAPRTKRSISVILFVVGAMLLPWMAMTVAMYVVDEYAIPNLVITEFYIATIAFTVPSLGVQSQQVGSIVSLSWRCPWCSLLVRASSPLQV